MHVLHEWPKSINHDVFTDHPNKSVTSFLHFVSANALFSHSNLSPNDRKDVRKIDAVTMVLTALKLFYLNHF